ncbi:MAG TPA: condensation domain-containing protein [Candidatus Angelobacter sp.]|nr:condensation domain-containing protein [Candidatus Angelobacter sp.]
MSSHSQSSGNIQAQTAIPALERHPGRREYPLSLNQQHMWFQSQLDSESSLWNLGAKMSVAGKLNVELFVQAIQNTVDRHEILRTIFIVADDVPVQQVLDVTVECAVRDLPPGLSMDDREKTVWTLMSELADPVYDLAAGPLFRTRLLRASANQHYFIVGFHHLLLDAFYSGQFMKEIVTAYDLLRRGEPLPPGPGLQYGDFCIWQQERWSQGRMADTTSFWREQLREPLPEIELPTDSTVPFPRVVRSQVTLNLNPGTVKKLREIGRQARTTLFRVMLATFTLFFSRMSESGELMLDIDFSTRPREMGHSIGFFANLLPVRFKVREEETFLDLLRAVDLQVRNVSANREFPVRQLTRKLKGRRHAMQPLSPIVVTQLGELDWSLGDLHLTGSIYVTASIHDLWLGVMERDDDLEVILAYSHELFDSTRAREWADWVEKTVQRVVAQPNAPVLQLMLPEDQQNAFWMPEKAKASAAGSSVTEVTVQRAGPQQNA